MEARQNGTLEAMLVSETPLTTILIASAAYPFVLLALRTVIYLAWGALLVNFPIREANWLGAGAPDKDHRHAHAFVVGS